MKPFRFKNFTLNQSKNVFRVGTDGVLAGILSTVEQARYVLEVGTGTGLISLMIAQRNTDAKIIAVDINEEAVQIASENFKNSPFAPRLNIQLQDFKTFKTDEKFDLIISNPPYFEANSSSKDIWARQQTELSFSDLIQKSVTLLFDNGQLSVIIPFESGDFFEKTAQENGLSTLKRIKIFGIKDASPKRWILEFGFNKVPVIEEEFTIEKSPRVYSDEYLEKTQEFHVFNK